MDPKISRQSLSVVLLTKMYMSEIYFYQRTGLQPLKMREKLSLTLGTPIVGHPVPKKNIQGEYLIADTLKVL